MNVRSFSLQKFDPYLDFYTLPGEFFQSLVKLGFCANPISERICYYLSESVFGMDSKNIDKVKCFTHVGALTHSFTLARTHSRTHTHSRSVRRTTFLILTFFCIFLV